MSIVTVNHCYLIFGIHFFTNLIALLCTIYSSVDAFNERYNSGILGRMNDVLGNSMATGQIAMKTLQANLVGDPSLGRKVDILGVYGNGVNPFYRVNNGIAGVSQITHH